MSALETLLEIQASDTTADQLQHRRAHLPARAELAANAARRAEVTARLDEVNAVRADVLGRQAKVEQAITAAGLRIKEIEGRLYSGQVSATKDILAMTAEVDSLKARRSVLEDDLLATMEEEEPLSEQVAGLEGALTALSTEAVALQSVLVEGEREIDAELAGVAAVRQQQVGQVPGELLATYEMLRARLGGEGAARLNGRSCSGCHLTLPAQELDRIKREPPDTVILCDQCGRILVR